MYRLFSCIPILGVFFRLKSVKKMCLCDKFKKRNVTYEKCIY